MRALALARAPGIHFLAIGALAFLLRSFACGDGGRPAVAARAPIAFDAARVAELREALAGADGAPPDRAALVAAIERSIDEELLFREALARGLDRDDPGVERRLRDEMLFLGDDGNDASAAELVARARSLGLDREDPVIRALLVEKMRLAATALDPARRPDDAALARAWRARQASLRGPERRSLVHVFLGRDRRGDALTTDAESLRRRLERLAPTSDAAAARAIALGDAFALGGRLEGRSRDELERSFGADFAAGVFALPPARWSPPLASAYGVHLVWIERIEPGAIPPLDAVRERLRGELEDAMRERQLAALLAALRTRYDIAVAWPAEEPD